MTEKDDPLPWTPPMFGGMQEASEKAMEQQRKLMQGMLGANASGLDMNQLGAMSGMATFKTRVQSGGRISIPDAEREALDMEEGDIVQAVVLPVKRSRE
jgi:hypothetical protein